MSNVLFALVSNLQLMAELRVKGNFNIYIIFSIEIRSALRAFLRYINKNSMNLHNNDVKSLIKIVQVITEDSYIKSRLPNYMKNIAYKNGNSTHYSIIMSIISCQSHFKKVI